MKESERDVMSVPRYRKESRGIKACILSSRLSGLAENKRTVIQQNPPKLHLIYLAFESGRAFFVVWNLDCSYACVVINLVSLQGRDKEHQQQRRPHV